MTDRIVNTLRIPSDVIPQVGAPNGIPQLDATGIVPPSQLPTPLSPGEVYVNSNLYASTANALSNGVVGLSLVSGGSGGTDGNFALSASGGGGSGFAGNFTVSGGVVIALVITSHGANYTSAPTISLSASSGLTGASVVAVIGQNQPPTTFFLVSPSSDVNGAYDIYENVAGVATLRGTLAAPSLTLVANLTGAIASGSTLYTATGPASFTSLTAGAVALVQFVTTNTGNITLTINPTGGGSPIGPFSVFTITGAQIPAGFIRPNGKYMLVGHSSTTWRIIALDTIHYATQFSIIRNGAEIIRLFSTANNELSFLQDDGSGNLIEYARFDRSTKAFRLFNGRYLMGTTASGAIEVYSPYNLQTYVQKNATYIANAIWRRAAKATLEDITVYNLNTTVPYYPSAGDYFRHIRVSTANAYVDCRHLPQGDMFRFVVDATGASVKFYSDNNWRGKFGNVLTFPAGSVVTIERITNSDFIAIEYTGISPTVSTAARTIANYTIGGIGQSRIARFFVGGGLAGFQDNLISQSISQDINWINGAVGGCALIKGNESTAGNYLWDPATSTPGPTLSNFITAMLATVAAGQPQPAMVILRQGLQDASSVASTGSTTAATVESAYDAVCAYIRSALGIANLTILVCPLGGDDTSVINLGETVMREAHVRVAAKTNNIQGPDFYDVSRTYSNVHQDFYGAYVDGYRLGLTISNILFGKSNFLGPEFSNWVEVDPQTFTIDLTTDPASSALDNADNPIPTDAYSVRSNTNAYDATYATISSITRAFISGSLHRFTIKTAAPASGYILSYPFGSAGSAARSGRVIKTLLSQLPIRTWNNNFT